MAMIDVLAEVAQERVRQEQLWGEQNWNDGTGSPVFAAFADVAKARCKRAGDNVTWKMILDEEVGEAFAEEDHARLREELIQVAAVAVNWVEAIDRRAS